MFRILDRDAARRLEMRRMLYRMMLFSEDFSYEDAAGIPREGTDALLLIRPEAEDAEMISPCLSGELSGIPVICYGTQTAPRFAPGVPVTVCAERRPADLRELLLCTVLDLTGRRIDEWQVGALSDHLLEPSPRVFGTPVHLSQIVLLFFPVYHTEELYGRFRFHLLSLLRDAVQPLDARDLRLQHFPSQIGDLIDFSLFFLPDKADQSVLFHFG